MVGLNLSVIIEFLWVTKITKILVSVFKILFPFFPLLVFRSFIPSDRYLQCM